MWTQRQVNLFLSFTGKVAWKLGRSNDRFWRTARECSLDNLFHGTSTQSKVVVHHLRFSSPKIRDGIQRPRTEVL